MQNKNIVSCCHLKKGFTLAEVLITLGIIGVVAAITMPTLISKYQNKVLIESTKVTFSIIQEGVKRALVSSEVEKFEDTDLFQACKYGEDIVYDKSKCQSMMSKYFKIVRFIDSDDKPGNLENCVNVGKFPLVYYKLGDTTKCIASDKLWYIIVLENGANVSFNLAYSPNLILPMAVDVDVTGLKGPNKLGKDVFRFLLFSNGTLTGYSSTQHWHMLHLTQGTPEMSKDFLNMMKSRCNSSSSYSIGFECSGRLIDNGWVMDY